MNDTLLLAFASALLMGWGVVVFTLASRGGNTVYDPDDYDSTLCAPSRHADITANTAQPAAAPRRIVAELAPPAGWRDVGHVAILPAAAAVQYDAWDEDEDPDELDAWGDEPWLVVEDWPKQQAAQPEPVPLVVNRTAARFASLEVRR